MIDRSTPRIHERKVDYSVNNYYRYFRKKFPQYNSTIPRKLYGTIIKTLFEKIRDKMTEEPYDYKMPNRLGMLKIRKIEKVISVAEDGTIKHNLMPNWKATLELWETNEECKKTKKLIFHDSDDSGKYKFKIIYSKRHAKYPGSSVFRIKSNRAFSRQLSKKIKEGSFDTFIL